MITFAKFQQEIFWITTVRIIYCVAFLYGIYCVLLDDNKMITK